MRPPDPTRKLELKTLFSWYADELRHYLARQVRCDHTAADLVQDAFVRFALTPGAAGETNARAYLYRIANNLAIDHFRAGERRQTVRVAPEDLAHIADEAPIPERLLDGQQHWALLENSLRDLPPLTQQILRLNRLEGMTYPQIARRLNISDSSVQKHLSRALRHAMRSVRSGETR